MADYAAINLRFKLKNDAPEFIKQFLNTFFFEQGIEKAVADLDNADIVTPLSVMKYYPEGPECLDSMILQCSEFHRAWCWRVREEHEDYALYESKASCTHRSTDEDLIILLMTGLRPWLDVQDGDVLARVIYESASVERVFVYDEAGNTIVGTNGYRHKWSNAEGNGDGSHPREQSRYYDSVLPQDPEKGRFVRMVTDEFYPPWNIAEISVLNVANEGKWAVERSENRGFGF